MSESKGTNGKSDIITLSKVNKSFWRGKERLDVLKDLDLTMKEGSFEALMGPSGSGKSTLLNLIAGLDRATEGSLHMFGQDLAAMSSLELSLHRRRNVGVIFQSFNLVPTMSAAENVALAMMFAGVARDERQRQAAHLLGAMGLGDRQQHRPRELSGGEQQRVAIARALANKPHLLLADEPTGNLDSRTTREIMDVLKDLNAREGKTIILVTHDAELAAIADSRLVLRDGRVVEHV